MKIIQLTAENVKKLKIVDITPKKDFIQITGPNGSGKSSVLDSIWWALAGGKAIQGQPIRKGEEKAAIKLNLGEIVVIRRFTPSGTTLVVENADGFRAASPQAMLDAIIGNLTFDPLEFSRMTSKEQFETLRKIADIKIDFDALAKHDAADIEKRRDINRDVKNLEGELFGIVIADDAPDEAVSITDLMKELGDLEDHNSVVQANEAKREKYQGRLLELQRQKDDLEARLIEVNTALAEGESLKKALPNIEAQSTEDVKARLAGAEAKNKAHAAKVRRGEINAQVALKQKASDEITDILEARAADRVKALQSSKMPIAGLTLGESEVMFNDIPFLQLSSAEQLRVSVAIAMAANPKLKVIRIKDGSLLDDNSLKMIQEMAADKEYQVWCESVNTSGKVGIVMEDGEVAAVNDE